MIWQWTRPGTPSNTFDTMIKRMIVDTRENQYLDVLTSRWQVVVARRYIEQGHMLNISDLKITAPAETPITKQENPSNDNHHNWAAVFPSRLRKHSIRSLLGGG
jgi:hypothetical protein